MAASIKTSRWCFAALLSVSLVSCNTLDVWSQQAKTIESLPERTPGSTIEVTGVVEEPVSLLDQGAYKLRDETGHIWVLTDTSLPEPGSTLTVTGELRFHELRFQGENFGEWYLLQSTALETPAVEQQSTRIDLDAAFELPASPPEEVASLEI